MNYEPTICSCLRLKNRLALSFWKPFCPFWGELFSFNTQFGKCCFHSLVGYDTYTSGTQVRGRTRPAEGAGRHQVPEAVVPSSSPGELHKSVNGGCGERLGY